MLSYTATLKSGIQPDVVLLSDVKAHLNITHEFQDNLIQSYIDAAITEAENYTQRSLKIYEVTATAQNFSQNIKLENTPYKGALVIKYRDANNAEQTLAASNYTLNYYYNEPVIVFNDFSALPNLYDRIDAVTITYEVGYANNDVVPNGFKTFVRLYVGHLYEFRSDTVDKLPRFMYSTIRPYKKWD